MICQREGSGSELQEGIPRRKLPFLKNQKIWPSEACCTSLLRKLGSLPTAQGVRPVTLRAMLGKQLRAGRDRIRLPCEGITLAAICLRNPLNPRIVDRTTEQNGAKHHPRDKALLPVPHRAPRRNQPEIC